MWWMWCSSLLLRCFILLVFREIRNSYTKFTLLIHTVRGTTWWRNPKWLFSKIFFYHLQIILRDWSILEVEKNLNLTYIWYKSGNYHIIRDMPRFQAVALVVEPINLVITLVLSMKWYFQYRGKVSQIISELVMTVIVLTKCALTGTITHQLPLHS